MCVCVAVDQNRQLGKHQHYWEIDGHCPNIFEFGIIGFDPSPCQLNVWFPDRPFSRSLCFEELAALFAYLRHESSTTTVDLTYCILHGYIWLLNIGKGWQYHLLRLKEEQQTNKQTSKQTNKQNKNKTNKKTNKTKQNKTNKQTHFNNFQPFSWHDQQKKMYTSWPSSSSTTRNAASTQVRHAVGF